jgi:hypothetical protein
VIKEGRKAMKEGNEGKTVAKVMKRKKGGSRRKEGDEGRW